jgi:ribosome-binding factor A
MREEVGRSITLFKLPLLRFAHDESVERGERLDRLLQKISKPPKASVRRVTRRKK